MQMKSSFRDADANGDGIITLDELTAKLGNYSQPRRSTAPQTASAPSTTTVASSGSSSRASSNGSGSSSDSGSSSKKSFRFLSPQERLPRGLPEWYSRKDADGDGQVSMSEYAVRNGSKYPPWNTTTWKDWLGRQGINAEVLCCPAKNRGQVDASHMWDGSVPAADYTFYPPISGTESFSRIDVTSTGRALPNDTVLALDKDFNHREKISSGDCSGWNKLYADGRVIWHAKND